MGRNFQRSAPSWTAAIIGGDDGSFVGDLSDIKALRGADDTGEFVQLAAANIPTYFDGANAAMNATALWFIAPLMAAGYSSFMTTLRNNLGVSVTVTMYLASYQPGGSFLGVGGILDKLLACSTPAAAVAVADGVTFYGWPGGGAVTASTVNSTKLRFAPVGWLALKVAPAGDPAAGYLTLSIERGG